jgi:MFS family permease
MRLELREWNTQRVLPGVLAASGISLGLAGGVRSPLGLVAVFALLGAAYAAFLALSNMTFQHHVPEERKGRLFALLATVSAGLIPLSFLGAGVAADAFTSGLVLEARGAGMFVLALWSLFSRRPAEAGS